MCKKGLLQSSFEFIIQSRVIKVMHFKWLGSSASAATKPQIYTHLDDFKNFKKRDCPIWDRFRLPADFKI